MYQLFLVIYSKSISFSKFCAEFLSREINTALAYTLTYSYYNVVLLIIAKK